MPALIFSDVYFSYTTKPLIQRLSFSCGPAERLCIVGPNGAGKSTILRLACGELRPERGTVTGTATPPPLTEAQTVGEVLDHATAEHLELQQRFDALTTDIADDHSPRLAEEYDEVLARMTALDVWSVDAQVGTVLAGLGLAGVERETSVDKLSPGQRGRLDLAGIIISRPTSLVLDEPTNHLDAAGVAFLAETLLDWDGPVLLVSHDRAFVDRVATGILDLDTAAWEALAVADGHRFRNAVYRSRGNYSDYLVAKSDARATHTELHERQQAEKYRLTQHQRDSDVVGHSTFTPRSETRMAKKFYADRAQKVSTRRISDDEKRLVRLESVEVRKPREEATGFPLPPASPGSGVVIDLRGAEVPGRLKPVSAQVSGGEHLLVTGPNGAGKSTLLELIADTHPAIYLPQRLPRREDLPGDVWEDGIGELGQGFVHPRYWSTPVPELSDGNRRRVQLALAASAHPGILLVDEPTNYLDLDAIDSLERSLSGWNGTLVVATHDRWLIDNWEGSKLDLA